RGGPAVCCITFGQPAVGNSALKRYVRQRGWEHHFLAMIIPEDIVPPLLLMPRNDQRTSTLAVADGGASEGGPSPGSEAESALADDARSPPHIVSSVPPYPGEGAPPHEHRGGDRPGVPAASPPTRVKGPRRTSTAEATAPERRQCPPCPGEGAPPHELRGGDRPGVPAASPPTRVKGPRRTSTAEETAPERGSRARLEGASRATRRGGAGREEGGGRYTFPLYTHFGRRVFLLKNGGTWHSSKGTPRPRLIESNQSGPMQKLLPSFLTRMQKGAQNLNQHLTPSYRARMRELCVRHGTPFLPTNAEVRVGTGAVMPMEVPKALAMLPLSVGGASCLVQSDAGSGPRSSKRAYPGRRDPTPKDLEGSTVGMLAHVEVAWPLGKLRTTVSACDEPAYASLAHPARRTATADHLVREEQRLVCSVSLEVGRALWAQSAEESGLQKTAVGTEFEQELVGCEEMRESKVEVRIRGDLEIAETAVVLHPWQVWVMGAQNVAFSKVLDAMGMDMPIPLVSPAARDSCSPRPCSNSRIHRGQEPKTSPEAGQGCQLAGVRYLAVQLMPQQPHNAAAGSVWPWYSWWQRRLAAWRGHTPDAAAAALAAEARALAAAYGRPDALILLADRCSSAPRAGLATPELMQAACSIREALGLGGRVERLAGLPERRPLWSRLLAHWHQLRGTTKSISREGMAADETEAANGPTPATPGLLLLTPRSRISRDAAGQSTDAPEGGAEWLLECVTEDGCQRGGVAWERHEESMDQAADHVGSMPAKTMSRESCDQTMEQREGTGAAPNAELSAAGTSSGRGSSEGARVEERSSEAQGENMTNRPNLGTATVHVPSHHWERQECTSLGEGMVERIRGVEELHMAVERYLAPRVEAALESRIHDTSIWHMGMIAGIAETPSNGWRRVWGLIRSSDAADGSGAAICDNCDRKDEWQGTAAAAAIAGFGVVASVGVVSKVIVWPWIKRRR
ncbi:hypothetical protein CYMTET_27343, partial [Cymbomonas tetramitiformis]